MFFVPRIDGAHAAIKPNTRCTAKRVRLVEAASHVLAAAFFDHR